MKSAKAKECQQAAFQVQFSGQAYLLRNGTTSLEVIFHSGSEISVDKLFLQIENQRFQPLDWKPVKVKDSQRQFNMFDLKHILESVPETSLGRAAFIALSGSKEFASPPFDITTLIM